MNIYRYIFNKNIKIKNSKLFISKIILFGLFFAFSFNLSDAQDLIDSKGKDFWLTFMPNLHNRYRYEDDAFRLGDSLYIFLAADKPTDVVIDYQDRNGNKYSRNIKIVDANTVYTFKLCYYNFELTSFNNHMKTSDYSDNHCEKISQMSFHITSSEEINVYAHNQAETTSEAMMLIPTNALGIEHFILSYNSDDQSVNDMSISSTPSQFAVVAVEDSTIVTIKPSCPTQYNGMKTQKVEMNKGDVYLVQALLLGGESNYDLTGSHVSSTKPVAVFSGHQRARIPIEVMGSDASRDILLEQMPPVSTWGKSVFLTPYAQLPDMSYVTYDLYRILAAYDNTEVYINNVKMALLHRGDYYENILNKAATVNATGPILVGQYKKTSQFNYNGTDNVPGDPFLMVIPPKEQFLKFYRVINTQAYETRGYDDSTKTYIREKVYDYQYITIIAPDNSIKSVRIDGVQVQQDLFLTIPGSGYSYANPSVTDGVHTVEANAPIGIYVYGYGGANSYGYIGGMGYTPFDYNCPELSYTVNCYEVSGSLYDTSAYDTGISVLKNVTDSSVNVTVAIDSFKSLQKSVGFNAKLINNRHDGVLALSSVDGYENKGKYRIDIPGFTVAVKGTNPDGPTPAYTFETRVQNEFCFEIILENYGNFDQHLSKMQFKNNLFTIKSENFDLISKGGEKKIKACIYLDTNATYIDTLLVENECGKWEMAIISVVADFDRNPPTFAITSDPCDTEFSFTITDSLKSDFGLKSVVFKELVNCTSNSLFESSAIHRYELKVTDQYNDAIYEIEAIDEYGWSFVRRDTVQGFTLKLSTGQEPPIIDFHEVFIGNKLCDTLNFTNYGILPLVFNDAKVYNNVLFSIPQSQFPLVIEPSETVPLEICFKPLKSNENSLNDTLRIDFKCLNMIVPFTGIAEAIESEGINRCDVPIRVITTSVPAGYVLEQNVPNPVADDITSIRFGLSEENNVQLNVFSINGMKVLTLAEGIYKAGLYQAEANTRSLPDGVYFYELKTAHVKLTKMFVIRR